LEGLRGSLPMLTLHRRLPRAKQSDQTDAGVAQIGRVLDVRSLDASAVLRTTDVLTPAASLAPTAVGMLLGEQVFEADRDGVLGRAPGVVIWIVGLLGWSLLPLPGWRLNRRGFCRRGMVFSENRREHRDPEKTADRTGERDDEFAGMEWC